MKTPTTGEINKMNSVVSRSGIKTSSNDDIQYTIFLVLDELLKQNKELTDKVSSLERKVKGLS